MITTRGFGGVAITTGGWGPWPGVQPQVVTWIDARACLELQQDCAGTIVIGFDATTVIDRLVYEEIDE